MGIEPFFYIKLGCLWHIWARGWFIWARVDRNRARAWFIRASGQHIHL